MWEGYAFSASVRCYKEETNFITHWNALHYEIKICHENPAKVFEENFCIYQRFRIVVAKVVSPIAWFLLASLLKASDVADSLDFFTDIQIANCKVIQWNQPQIMTYASKSILLILKMVSVSAGKNFMDKSICGINYAIRRGTEQANVIGFAPN